MTEGIVRIYLSYVEPEDKNLLWLRPHLSHEGYDLLYFGSCGWQYLCCHHHEHCHHVECKDNMHNCGCNKKDIMKEEPLPSIPDSKINGTEGSLWQLGPDEEPSLPEEDPGCGCAELK